MSPEDLFPYQLEGARFLSSKRRAGLFDDPGVGKTAQAIRALDDCGKGRGLIVAPAAVREVWAGEFKKFARTPRKILKGTDINHLNLWLRGKVDVLLLSYQMARTWGKRLENDVFDFIVFDECFPAGTIVETEIGPVSIDQIVSETLPIRVWCEGLRGLELQPVTRYIKSKSTLDILRIDHECGSLICTANHTIFVEGKGYVRAEAVRENDSLRVVRENCNADVLASSILRDSMCREMAIPYVSARHVENASCAQRDTPTRLLTKNEEIKFRSGVSRQTGQHIEVAERENLGWSKRGKRFHYGASTSFVFDSWLAGRPNGSHDFNSASKKPIQESPQQLQGRYSASYSETSNRSRRFKPSNETMETFRCEKNRSVKRSRVVSISLHQPRSETGCDVYNIEVRKHHNYFANRILVGNCHYLKNRHTEWTRALLGSDCDGRYGLARWAGNAWFLTGTPNPNDVADIWSTMRFCGATPCSHRIFTDRYFRKRVGTYSTSHTVREEMVPELKMAIASFSLRRTKAQAGLQLPPIWLTTINVDGDTDEVRALLRDHPNLEEAIKEAVEKGGLSFLDAQHIATLRRLVGEAKAPAFAELLIEELHNGLDRIVVFGVHRRALDHIQSRLKRAGVSTVRFDGGTTDSDRGEAVRRFQSGDAKVFLGNIRAAGNGLTLTAASDVIMFESDWSPAGNAQALMRVHRIGQTKQVHARFVVLANSIDEYVSEVVARKTRDIIKLGTFSEVAA